jgi:hypothetical protein
VIELAFQTYTIDHRRPNLATDSIDLYIIAMYIIVKICINEVEYVGKR